MLHQNFFEKYLKMEEKLVVCWRMFCERRSAVTIPVPQWVIRNPSQKIEGSCSYF